MAKLEQRIEALIEPIIQQAGYQLYDVYYIKEGKDYYLRVFLTKPEGSISIEDCETVSNLINPVLDEKGDIQDQYFLEVSSTGVERVLRKEAHLQEAKGEWVQANLFKPIDKQKIYIGKLMEVEETSITLEMEEKTVLLERNNIALLKLYYDWDNA